MEEGAVSQRMQAASGAGKGNGMEMDSPLEPPEGTEPCQHLDFSLKRPYRTSDL